MSTETLATEALISKAAELIDKADYLLITAGAGLSADSGLAVFAAQSAHPVLKAANMTYDQVVCGNNLARDPAFFFGFYASAAAAYSSATPHEGYTVLKALVERVTAKQGNGRVLVLTTNVDGMFSRVGVSAMQLHGSAHRFQCGGRLNATSRFPLYLAPRCSDTTFSAPAPASFAVDANTLRAQNLPTPCASCGGTVRPNIYLFGDGGAFAESKQENTQWAQWREEAERAGKRGARIVVLEIGAGLRVPVLRKRGEELISALPNAALIRINPDYAQQCLVSPAPRVIVSLALASKPALLAIAQRLNIKAS